MDKKVKRELLQNKDGAMLPSTAASRCSHPLLRNRYCPLRPLAYSLIPHYDTGTALNGRRQVFSSHRIHI